MKYSTYYQFDNENPWTLHFYFSLKGVLVLWQNKKYRKYRILIWVKLFCIWFYMIEYDVYHRKTLFRVISITTKPCKHSKHNEIWRNTSKQKSNNLTIYDFYPWSDALQSSKLACTICLMSQTRIRPNKTKLYMILMFFFFILIPFYFLGKKLKLTYRNCGKTRPNF